ncbi:hypothetical protein Pen02_38940 [Plantactinospora endophytica]|uniref:Transposase n=1 Tax=Plantactinospora endophytica TaxID=673535 RepID=A0ABQ4E2N5_9ACTN|nr:hypothetical protein Pen02_38940 [Plantactinospora endophytica]
MRRLLRYLTGRPYHRRDWRRLWLFCRCGHRWCCPASSPSASVIPDRAAFRAGVRRAQAEAAITRVAATVRQTHPAPGRRVANRRDGWNSPTRAYPRLSNGRAGNLTPAQEHRARHSERV